MLTEKQIDVMLSKLTRFEATLEPLMFTKVDEVEMMAFHTGEKLHSIPVKTHFAPCNPEDSWLGEGTYCWFLGQYTVPEQQEGKTLFVYPKIKGYEGLLWVNNKPFGNFASKYTSMSHGNHYCDLLKKKVAKNEMIEIALEYYAHHYVMGTKPFQVDPIEDYKIVYHGVDICVKNDPICDAYYNLKIVNQMAAGLDKNSFRRAEVIKTLRRVHEIVYYDYDNIDQDTFLNTLTEANLLLKELLKDKNSASAPYAGLIGHSHMDTAWLWDIDETVKKCARTYSNQMNLMEQYPDYTFVQSSAYHAAMMKEFYPELFEDMKKQVAAGKYEPNGGVWIECDCNIPSGESVVRQFLWGQRFTREHFNYTSDSFWLPDTFGYSASLPQIMKGCGVKYFLTTKMIWGDTTEFPYDTFYWKGIDGTKALVHINKIHSGPDPNNMLEGILNDGKNSIKERTVSNMRLLSYGVGDGGGGPEFEMIEIANRLGDVEGLPRSSHTTVSEFMKRLERTIVEPSTYTGELYLELHRGTLTNQHTIKRNNRLAEMELRNLEYFTVRDAIANGVIASDSGIRPLMEDLLVNQFHDILPGTCIPKAHEQSIRETTKVIEQSKVLIEGLLKPQEKKYTVSVANTLSFDRDDVLYLDYMDGYIVEGNYKQQIVTDLGGNKKLAVMGVVIPAFSSVILELTPSTVPESTAFVLKDNQLTTPLVTVIFNEKGYIQSFVDNRIHRELKGEGYALNTFLIAEDVPSDWDNWDLDADSECKFKDTAKLMSRTIVADGEVEFRIRSEYELTSKSTLIQDMIFYAGSAEVRFDTIMNWQDDHRFLKTAFDTSIHSDFVRQEVQFGHIKRVTNRNTAVEKAKFEVSNHKYTDLSETRYGVAILNDCKYGISVNESQLRLSLHKGGCRPDYKGDKGSHACCYAFYPHDGGFSASGVIKPAYQFNYKPIAVAGVRKEESLLKVSAENIIVETVKPLEDNEKAYIIRLYEAEGTYTNTKLRFTEAVKGLAITNMLEEVIYEFPVGQEVELNFNAFEIITLKINY
jgi:alpha-mannosidase